MSGSRNRRWPSFGCRRGSITGEFGRVHVRRASLSVVGVFWVEGHLYCQGLFFMSAGSARHASSEETNGGICREG